jgi:hypothetical protein
MLIVFVFLARFRYFLERFAVFTPVVDAVGLSLGHVIVSESTCTVVVRYGRYGGVPRHTYNARSSKSENHLESNKHAYNGVTQLCG